VEMRHGGARFGIRAMRTGFFGGFARRRITG